MIRHVLQQLAAQTGDDKLFRAYLHFEYGHCPGGCRDGVGGPTGRVYRSSWRSLTQQCTTCQLQWTMTVHRLAQIAATKAKHHPDAHQRFIAQVWAQWAKGINDQRGRRKRVSARRTHKMKDRS